MTNVYAKKALSWNWTSFDNLEGNSRDRCKVGCYIHMNFVLAVSFEKHVIKFSL